MDPTTTLAMINDPDYSALDEAVTLQTQMSKEGNSVRMTIGGKAGSIEVSGKTDPFHFHIEDEVTPRIVRDITRVNRADGSGKAVPPGALRKVYAAVTAKLKELQADYGSESSTTEATTMDPTTTLAMINDPDYSSHDRAILLLELIAWLRMGGFMPCGEPGTEMHPTLTDEACEAMREHDLYDEACSLRARLAYGD